MTILKRKYQKNDNSEKGKDKSEKEKSGNDDSGKEESETKHS